MQDTIYWLWLQACLTLTVTWTLKNCRFFTPTFITICSSCTLGIGLRQKSDIVCLWFVTKSRHPRYMVGGILAVTDWATEWRPALRFYLFELCWWKSVHTIYFKIRVFGSPNIQLSQNVVESALEVLWMLAYARKCGIQVSGSWRSSAGSLCRCCLLRFTHPRCSSIMEPEWQKQF